MRIFRPNLYRADLPGADALRTRRGRRRGSKAFISVGWSMAFQPVKAMTPQSSRIARKNSCDDPHVSFPASEAGPLQATMSSLELTPRVIFFLHQLGWTLIAARGNHPWQVPRDEGCSRFNYRLNPVGRCDIPISGPPENKIRPGKSEKAIQHQATLSV